MKKPILLLTLLFSVNAFAASAPEWWSTSSCKKEAEYKYIMMLKDGYSFAEARERSDNYFKTCVCSAGDETKAGVDSLLQGHEIEVVLTDPYRLIPVPIEYGRDFIIMWRKNQCYLSVNTPELCKNEGFMSEARQSFRSFDTYDEKRDLCVVDLENEFFKTVH
ncbi:MAG: hypothetical protein RR517_06460 [Pseudomonas sp.]